LQSLRLSTRQHDRLLIALLRPTGAFFIFCVSLLSWSAPGWGADAPPAAAIASAHPLATEAGHEVLQVGGNAFDAAVAVTAALAVVEPYSSGLGGGGFWLLHRARDGFETMIDGRERAPLAAHRDMYLDEQGQVIENLSVNGPLAAGIPGTPAALAHLAKEYGKLPLEVSLAPAIRLAEEGFPVEAHYQEMAEFRLDVLRAHDESAQIFLRDGQVPETGALIRQPDLAETLRWIAKAGHQGFYGGSLARRLVEGMRAAGGIWRLEDLAQYEIVEREPLRGHYRGMDVVSAPPPSSGGVVLIEALNILAGYDLQAMDAATRTHVVVEAMRRAYRDRAEYLGDPDFVQMPLQMLMDPTYAAGLRASIRLDHATPSRLLPGIVKQTAEAADTTHFSILDARGNRVAATVTINYPFGSGFTVPGTGVLLNDEMDDFSVKPGSPNVYGLVGAEANAIAPGKRMLSSMTPTFLDDGERMAVVGTPGGSRIITMVLLATLEFIDGGDAQAMVARPRYHHQYLPDEIQFEPGAIEPHVQKRLRAMGHVLNEQDETYGNMQVVIRDKKAGDVNAASDPRGIGTGIVIDDHRRRGGTRGRRE
jgi:gamma-glutamyltranspeptidase / glutathione hydrolase